MCSVKTTHLTEEVLLRRAPSMTRAISDGIKVWQEGFLSRSGLVQEKIWNMCDIFSNNPIRKGAPFNGIRDCSQRELRVDSGVRGTQHASRRGTPWGVKPVDDDRLLPATRRMIGLPLWPMLTMRNLRKRRNSRQVEVAETPCPKWESGGHTGSLSVWAVLIPSASSRQLRVAGRLLWQNRELQRRVPPQEWTRQCQRTDWRTEAA